MHLLTSCETSIHVRNLSQFLLNQILAMLHVSCTSADMWWMRRALFFCTTSIVLGQLPGVTRRFSASVRTSCRLRAEVAATQNDTSFRETVARSPCNLLGLAATPRSQQSCYLTVGALRLSPRLRWPHLFRGSTHHVKIVDTTLGLLFFVLIFAKRWRPRLSKSLIRKLRDCDETPKDTPF